MRSWFLLAFALLLVFIPPAFAWEPPIGIPRPDFGIEETHLMYELGSGEDCSTNPEKCFDFGSGLEPYKDAGNGPYTHYLDNTHSDATDIDNPYGTESKPRKTILWYPEVIPPGSVVEVHGGPYTFGGSYRTIASNGNLNHPVFVRGIDQDNMPVVSIWIRATGSYVIFEYLDFDGGGFAFRGSNQDFMAIRHSEVQNAEGYGVAILRDNCRNIVVYNNNIHDRGDWQASDEPDYHGVGCMAAGDSYRIWIVDNHIHHNRGDAIQVGNSSSNYVYIGRNEMNHNRENAVDVKMSSHCIVSQNTCYGYRATSTSSGEAIRPNDEGPIDNFWIIFNDIYDSFWGINSGGTTAPPYIIGNKIHDLVGTETSSSIAIRGNYNGIGHYVNNVIYNVDRGIDSSDEIVVNNIISNASEYHIDSDVDTYNNLLWQNGDPVTTLGTGSCIDCIEEDPLFVDAAAGDFHLSAESPAIGSGIETDVYQTFFNLYGLDIRVDFDGNPRTGAWDIGAFEAEEPISCVTTELLLDYIDQWKQGSLTMPSLIDRIAKWKSGEGC